MVTGWNGLEACPVCVTPFIIVEQDECPNCGWCVEDED